MYIANPIVPVMASLIVLQQTLVMSLVMTHKAERRFELVFLTFHLGETKMYVCVCVCVCVYMYLYPVLFT